MFDEAGVPGLCQHEAGEDVQHILRRGPSVSNPRKKEMGAVNIEGSMTIKPLRTWKDVWTGCSFIHVRTAWNAGMIVLTLGLLMKRRWGNKTR
jgi:hypothetical protein